MQLFIQTQLNPDSKSVDFNKEESRHIAKVLRKKQGDIIHVTNGLGYLFTCELAIIKDKKCMAYVLEIKQEPARTYQLHLAVAPTKNNDRFEWFLEKATELGIDEITPILCEHSERKNIRLDRYQKVIKSALKQSLQTYLPKLYPLVSIEKLYSTTKDYDAVFFAHCEDEISKVSLKEKLEPNKRYLILTYPEGDFSTEEIQKAKENNWQEVSLGNTRLRTETAAIVACHSVAFINE